MLHTTVGFPERRAPPDVVSHPLPTPEAACSNSSDGSWTERRGASICPYWAVSEAAMSRPIICPLESIELTGLSFTKVYGFQLRPQQNLPSTASLAQKRPVA